MWSAPPRDASSLSMWFERSLAGVKVAARRVGLVLLAAWTMLGVAAWVLVVSTFDGRRGRELRRLLDLDRDSFGGSDTVVLTDAEADRAWELVQEVFWAALPWVALLGVFFVLVSAWSVALAVRAVSGRVAVSGTGASGTGELPVEPLGSLMSAAGRRVPAVLASGVVVFLVFLGVWVVAALPVVLAAALDAGGATIVLTSVFVVLLAGVVAMWLWVKLSLAVVLAAVGGHGIGVRRSWDLTSGQFWYAAGRLVITGLVAGALSGAVNSVSGFAQFLSVVVYLAIVLSLQVVAVAASVLITASGHLVTIDQLER
jgi:hypothetical protein